MTESESGSPTRESDRMIPFDIARTAAHVVAAILAGKHWKWSR